MKKSLLLSAVGLAAVFGASAQEVGRVISSVPVIQQVAVPRQICNYQPVAVQQPNSGAGSLMGAIAGGAMGNAIGDGGGRAVATVIGLVGGAVLGNRIEGSGTQVQNVQQCTTQTFFENRAVAYNVTYEYAGRQYTVQMPNDPGPTIRLQITPLGSNAAESPDYAGAIQPMIAAPTYHYAQPILSGPGPVFYPAPYYYRPYYPPLGVSLNFGYSRGHRHGHRRDWR